VEPARIGITMGDPAGVGPELCLAALRHFADADSIAPIVIGDWSVLRDVAKSLNADLPDIQVVTPAEFQSPQASATRNRRALVVDVDALKGQPIEAGQVSAHTGEAAYQYLTHSIEWAKSNVIDAITTAPLNKGALSKAGIDFPGHTEILATQTATRKYCMMLTSPAITCSLVTTHIGLNDVAASLSTERIVETIELTAEAVGRLRGRPPNLAVCGLNPHAGEQGLFGEREEERLILPAVEWAQQAGLNVRGPLPADTAFVPAMRREIDAYVCMYHDQGLIPLKTLAFDEAVNVTLGLPIIRTSVDHGTALDIAWTGAVRTSNMMHAVQLAADLHAGR
jgi:4-phospho-D-threonate 3-dehydrogenase / 4-phospho-D-erythronate 3-dehydrogenase